MLSYGCEAQIPQFTAPELESCIFTEIAFDEGDHYVLVI